MTSEERELEFFDVFPAEFPELRKSFKRHLDQHAEEAKAEHDQWISTTDRQPPSLKPGHFRKYLVSCNGLVFECSWLFGGWHKRHDGCSECHPDAWQYMPTPYLEKEDEL